jgi:hypothetical protein
MSESEQDGASIYDRHGSSRHSVMLQAFRSATPASWFAWRRAGSGFTASMMSSPSLIPGQGVGEVSPGNCREPPPKENMYVVLKERLLSSHTLANFQKIKKLHQIDSCSGWPQTLGALSQMLKLCPRRLMSSFSYSCQKVWSLMLTIGVEIVWIARSRSSSRSRRCPSPLLPEDSVICMRICWASRRRLLKDTGN